MVDKNWARALGTLMKNHIRADELESKELKRQDDDDEKTMVKGRHPHDYRDSRTVKVWELNVKTHKLN